MDEYKSVVHGRGEAVTSCGTGGFRMACVRGVVGATSIGVIEVIEVIGVIRLISVAFKFNDAFNEIRLRCLGEFRF